MELTVIRLSMRLHARNAPVVLLRQALAAETGVGLPVSVSVDASRRQRVPCGHSLLTPRLLVSALPLIHGRGPLLLESRTAAFGGVQADSGHSLASIRPLSDGIGGAGVPHRRLQSTDLLSLSTTVRPGGA